MAHECHCVVGMENAGWGELIPITVDDLNEGKSVPIDDWRFKYCPDCGKPITAWEPDED